MPKYNLFRDNYIKPLLDRETEVIGRQRATAFIYSAALLVFGVLLNLCGGAGPVAPFFQAANSALGLVVLLCFYL